MSFPADPTTTYQLVSDEQRKIVLDQPGFYLIELTGEKAEAQIEARVSLRATEQFALKVVIRHQASHTKATTKLLGTATDQAFLTLEGKIIIEENCRQCESFLTERVLLLSPEAKAQVVPDLEIKNNDVHCSHAASISYIPAEQIFYLMSRGLSQAVAQKEIAGAFLDQ